MKKLKLILFLLLLIGGSICAYSQKVTAGFYSGINFSDIRGRDFGGKWSSKAGPSEGFYLGYSLNKTIGIQTGLGFSSVYYDYKTMASYYPIDYKNNSYNQFVYNLTSEEMNFSFVRVPLLLTFRIPSVVQFNLKTGMYLSFLQGRGFSGSYYYSNPVDARKNDYGFIFSSGISYPFNDKVRATLDGSVITGRQPFFNYSGLRHGSSEVTVGLEYLFAQKEKRAVNHIVVNDSVSKKARIIFLGGVNIAWNGHNSASEKYKALSGPSFGFLINFPLNYAASFITGVTFERTGYSFRDSSSSFYRNIKNGGHNYLVNANVSSDHAVIPFLFRFPLGKSQKLFFSTGTWVGIELNARNTGTAFDEVHSDYSFSERKTVIYDEIGKYVNDFTYGWLFDGGVELPMFSKYKFNIDLQYSFSFNDFYKESVNNWSLQNAPSSGNAIRLMALSLRLGITLPE